MDASAMATTEPALVVDMDGTLVRTDTLHEALLALVADPAAGPALLRARRQGKAPFKQAVADRALAAADRLPLDEDVIALIRAARAEGRRVALVSASDHRQVEAVAVGLFDEAFGTGSPEAEGVNLAGAAKAAFLTARYGAKGFDYIGDSELLPNSWTDFRRT